MKPLEVYGYGYRIACKPDDALICYNCVMRQGKGGHDWVRVLNPSGACASCGASLQPKKAA